MGGEGGPLVVEGAGEGRLPCPAVPVVGVPVLALFAVEVGVDAGGVGCVEVVDEGVRAVPVAVGVVPESVQEGWERGGFRGGEREGRRASWGDYSTREAWVRLRTTDRKGTASAVPHTCLRRAPLGAGVGLAVCGGEWVVLGKLALLCADGVVVDVVAVREEVFAVANATVGEASLPDRQL